MPQYYSYNEYDYQLDFVAGNEPEIEKEEPEPPDHITAVNTLLLNAIPEDIGRDDLYKAICSLKFLCETLMKSSGNNAKIMETLMLKLCGWSYRDMAKKTGESHETHRHRMKHIEKTNIDLYNLIMSDEIGALTVFATPPLNKSK